MSTPTLAAQTDSLFDRDDSQTEINELISEEYPAAINMQGSNEDGSPKLGLVMVKHQSQGNKVRENH